MKNKNKLYQGRSARLSFTAMPALICILILSASCDKMLVEKPKSVAVETFYNTASEVEAATNSIYAPLRASGLIPTFITTLECNNDFTYGRGSWAQMNEYQGFNSTNVNRVAGLWTGFYHSIRNANFVIKNAPNGTSISQADIDKYVGEAKFLRALNYFYMVRVWGGVPLRTEENMTEKDLAKSTTEQIYAQIVADLQEAELKLPDVQSVAGRPAKWAAKTLLADVYLQTGQYPEAAAKADEVIQSGKHSLVAVNGTNDFQKLFGPDVTTTPEEIFYLKYTRQVGQGNYMLWITNHPSTGLFNFGGAYVIYTETTNNAFMNWDDDDFRKGLWQPVNIGLGPNTLITSKYIDNQAVGTDGAGNDLPIYRYADLLLIFAEADARAAGAPTEAGVEALNQVHRRAYGYSPATPSPVDFQIADYDEETFVDLVIRERGYEFHMEGKRWLELKRTGKAEQLVMNAKGLTIAPMHYLWPIPTSELDFNKALDAVSDQNPGY